VLYFFKLSKNESKEKIIVSTGILAAATVIGSSISIPSPFGIPMHFFIIPLAAILLGPLTGIMVAFLCLLVQFLFLGMGGITSLGANVVTMGVVMSFSTYLFYKLTRDLDERLAVFCGTLMGIIMGTMTQVLMLLVAGVTTFEILIATLVPFYLFVAVIEGAFNVFIILFISKIKPEMLKIDKI
jgi:cobalt/nickel transport system permease protein